MRVTTNSIMRNYSSDLNRLLSERTIAGNKVTNHNKFDRSSEDPASALKASQIRRRIMQNDSYMDTVQSAQERLTSAEAALNSIQGEINKALKDHALTGLNGATGKEQRETLAATLREIQKSMLQFANSKHGDKYVFGGEHNDSPPFTIEADGTVKYVGENVTDGNAANINKLLGEKVFVDIGLGIENGAPSDSNAFNTSIPGIEFLGHGFTGTTSGGDEISNNVIELLGQMANALEVSDADWNNNGFNDFTQMTKVMETGLDNLTDQTAKIGVKSNYLETTLKRYKDLDISYQEQLSDCAYVDDASAISDYTYAQYAYTAALRVGNTLLSSSLIDFLKY